MNGTFRVAPAHARLELTLAGLELGTFAPYKGVSNEIDYFYLAKGLTWTEQSLEPSEEITVHRMPFDEARRRLLKQPLIDGQSIAGLALFDQFLA